MKEERLQKLISQSGLMSRRKAEEAIIEGRVEVNGQTVIQLGTKASKKDEISLDGAPIARKVKISTIALYKPAEVVTTKSDPQKRFTVMHLIPKKYQALYPVGRLDYHSEGLVLLTNDGELAQKIMHPSKGLQKKYRARVKGIPSDKILKKLTGKIFLEDGPGKFDSVRVVKVMSHGKSEIEVLVSEGRNHFIRRMLYRVGHPVIRLKRYAVGPINLGKMKRKDHRVLTSEETKAISLA